CTLVPDSVSQATSDHGWDLTKDARTLEPSIARLHAVRCRVSLFLDAVPDSMRLARELGADRVELYTEPYAAAFARGEWGTSLHAFEAAARAAVEAGLGVNAGHDLNLANLGPFLAAIPDVLEVSIGHALIADAIELGLRETVHRYLVIASGVATNGRP
ncbi:MAG: pyridoxine 5'-phosphate synthase, partial [Polyangiaceae bacterium]